MTRRKTINNYEKLENDKYFTGECYQYNYSILKEEDTRVCVFKKFIVLPCFVFCKVAIG